MHIENIDIINQDFTLIRTKKECEGIAKEIGDLDDENIALHVHFVESQNQAQVVDFEMITHIETEIAQNYTNMKSLMELHKLMIDLESNDDVYCLIY